jgi:Gluconate 2-dehydrogenase subunit 3
MQSALVGQRQLRNEASATRANAWRIAMNTELNRRALLARALLLLGATALPGEVLAASAKRARRFLSKPQFALLSAVSDTIVPVTDTPGALAAGIPAKLDGMLANWASAETRTKIIDALGRIDAAAMTQKKKIFSALSVADRALILRPHDATALKRVPAPANAPKPHPFSPTVWVADDGYLKLKELVVTLYYSSEIAMTKDLIYEHVPGAWVPSMKTTDTTRPWASTGPF